MVWTQSGIKSGGTIRCDIVWCRLVFIRNRNRQHNSEQPNTNLFPKYHVRRRQLRMGQSVSWLTVNMRHSGVSNGPDL